ncbi:putative multiple sugar transport system substrate-binding protein [Bifidobacterium bohemicum]|uniref:Multiple sugar-binding periplasmic protein SbpA n=1 Tax=Bifidobacterium bohemicum DSM 22767 TaxID=1437606 RepID=A0A086ZGE1_9BIFI|nr:sugar-binding protein [Bifidobacterium bohemicum]KFI45591.1 multiple sugar-binding periplasmic protein SbpA [Bifidobacterium bohemicum DSM 22767]SCC01179.1 putative multiple sugar transport system substrate-binding protein [Bifidobacterium bohemicum]
MRKPMKAVAIAAAATMILPVGACGGARTGIGAGSDGKGQVSVGISMPEQQLERWQIDGANLKKQLESYGYKVTLQYADGKTDLQSSQIQNMANQGANYMVIASIDGTATGAAAEQAQSNGAKIIAYDRLIMNTNAVDYYTTFSLTEVGRQQGEYIERKLGLKDGKKGPFNVELMSGSPADNNAKYYYEGAWSVLEPYFKSGVLQSKSGKVPKSLNDWQSIGIDDWDRQKGQAEMENRINSFYNNGTHLDAVLAPNDAIALGTVNAVEGAGWNYFPVITGQDAEKANVRAIIEGKQSMTVYKDTRQLAKATAQLIKQLVDGRKPDLKDTFDNGKKKVPSALLMPVSVDKDNAKKELVDSGYITAKDAGL